MFKPILPCSGPLFTSFLVPPGAPNGRARVIWYIINVGVGDIYMLTRCRQCAESSTCSFASISNGTGDALFSRQQEGTASCLFTSLQENVTAASGWGTQSLDPMIPTAPLSNNGSNQTVTSNLPPVTTDGPQINSSAQLTTPSTMPWTMLTVTVTVTSLLNTMLTSV